jgi:hypothetical protein
MSGWGDEAESSRHLAVQAAKKLHDRNPNHPLLKYLYLPAEDIGPDGEPKDLAKEEALRLEFKNRFWRNETPWQQEENGALVRCVTNSNYMVALERALRGEEGDFAAECL